MKARSGMLSHESDPVPLLRSSCAPWTQRGPVTVQCPLELAMNLHEAFTITEKVAVEKKISCLLTVGQCPISTMQCLNSILNVKKLSTRRGPF